MGYKTNNPPKLRDPKQNRSKFWYRLTGIDSIVKTNFLMLQAKFFLKNCQKLLR